MGPPGPGGGPGGPGGPGATGLKGIHINTNTPYLTHNLHAALKGIYHKQYVPSYVPTLYYF